jgi:hypothetical protein
MIAFGDQACRADFSPTIQSAMKAVSCSLHGSIAVILVQAVISLWQKPGNRKSLL